MKHRIELENTSGEIGDQYPGLRWDMPKRKLFFRQGIDHGMLADMNRSTSKTIEFFKPDYEFDKEFCRGDELCLEEVNMYYGDLTKNVLANEALKQITKNVNFVKEIRRFYLEFKANLALEYDFKDGFYHGRMSDDEFERPYKLATYELEKEKIKSENAKSRNFIKSELIVSFKDGKPTFGVGFKGILGGHFVSYEKNFTEREDLIKLEHPLTGHFGNVSLEYILRKERTDDLASMNRTNSRQQLYDGDLLLLKLSKKF